MNDDPVLNSNSTLSNLSSMGDPMQQQLNQDTSALEGLNKDVASIPPFDPNAQEPGAPQINPNGVMSTMPFLLALAALGGKAAGVHAKIMLNGVAGMTQGLVQGNQKAYQDAQQKYQDSYQRYLDKYKQQMQIFNEMRQVYKGRVDADLRALEIARKATGDMERVDQNALKAWQWEQQYAVKLEDSETKRRETEARTKELEARAAKEGAQTAATTGKESKKDVEKKKAVDEADAQIDDIIAKIKANPSSVGLIGYGKRAAETIGTAVGATDEAPAHELQTSMEALLLQLPKLLTGSSKSAKDERARVETIASALKVGVTAPIAIQKLQQLKQILAEQRGEQDQFEVGKVYKDAKGNKAVYKGNGQWQTQQ